MLHISAADPQKYEIKPLYRSFLWKKENIFFFQKAIYFSFRLW